MSLRKAGQSRLKKESALCGTDTQIVKHMERHERNANIDFGNFYASVTSMWQKGGGITPSVVSRGP